MQIVLIVGMVLQVMTPQGVATDSVDALRRLARQKEYRYERLLRTMAPRSFSGGWGSECDEIVGRFCLRFTETAETEGPWQRPEEPQQVIEARREAIDVFRRLFALIPEDFEVAGPLVRYLAEDDRSRESVSAAGAYAWASADSVWGPLLLGFALHANAEDEEAGARFAAALARMRPEDRGEIDELDVLVDRGERSRLRRLSPAALSDYRRRFWVLSDPLFLTPGNERWNEHVARHVWSRLLSRAPRVVGAVSWGKDLEELTVRYGVPTSRERIPGRNLWDDDIVERYDPESLAFTRPDLLQEGFPEAPPPGARPYLDAPRARGIYAPGTLSRLVALPHQVTRFPDGDSVVLRIDAEIPLDTLSGSVRTVQTGVFLLDSLVRPVAERRDGHRRNGRYLRLTEELRVAPGRYVYSVEALDGATRNAARARYLADAAPVPVGVLAVSDIVLARPFRDRPLPRSREELRSAPLVNASVPRDGVVGLYAEAHWLGAGEDGRSHFGVSVALEKAQRPPAVARLVRWIGRTLGLASPQSAPRVRWTADADPGRPAVLALDLDLNGAEPGLYRIEMRVRDLVLGTERSSSRLLLVSPGA